MNITNVQFATFLFAGLAIVAISLGGAKLWSILAARAYFRTIRKVAAGLGLSFSPDDYLGIPALCFPAMVSVADPEHRLAYNLTSPQTPAPICGGVSVGDCYAAGVRV